METSWLSRGSPAAASLDGKRLPHSRSCKFNLSIVEVDLLPDVLPAPAQHGWGRTAGEQRAKQSLRQSSERSISCLRFRIKSQGFCLEDSTIKFRKPKEAQKISQVSNCVFHVSAMAL